MVISVIIGGSETEDTLLRNLRNELGRPITLWADRPGTFVSFCKKAIHSTSMLTLRTGMTEEHTERMANDDIVVFFPKAYLDVLKIPLIYKLATVIETAIDMKLDVQAFSFVGEKDWNTHRLQWPSHWPTVSYFATKT